MPSPASSMHLASVDYLCTFASLSDGPVTFSALDPVHFTFNFETGEILLSPGVVQITTDYSWFNQATVEADITTAMQTISAAISELLSMPLVTVMEAGQVQRVWTFRPTVQGGGWSSGAVNSTDVYEWLPRISDSDSSRATDAGENVTAGLGDTDRGNSAETGFTG